MTPSFSFFRMLQSFEGLKLAAYKDSAGIATIGAGTIKYPNGTRVKMGDTCTEDEAIDWMKQDIEARVEKLNELLKGVTVTQNQFDALLSLMYNIGAGAFAASTLLKRIKSGSNDIRSAFMMWRKAKVNGELVEVEGLRIRREKEANLYLK